MSQTARYIYLNINKLHRDQFWNIFLLNRAPDANMHSVEESNSAHESEPILYHRHFTIPPPQILLDGTSKRVLLELLLQILWPNETIRF
jgi:hypothetical protein